MAAKKQYGLIVPSSKSKAAILNRPSVFGDDSSDEDEESRKKKVNKSAYKEGIKRLEAKNTRNMLTTALTEDPTVFDYDVVYDDMQEKKKANDVKLKAKKDTKSKYIERLKRTAAERKIEQEMAYERKVQKEQEADEELYVDKDSFVTPSYLKKLEERAEMEKKLKLEAEIEKMNDVTKQNDLSRFYRNVLERKTSSQPPSSRTLPERKTSSQIPHDSRPLHPSPSTAHQHKDTSATTAEIEQEERRHRVEDERTEETSSPILNEREETEMENDDVITEGTSDRVIETDIVKENEVNERISDGDVDMTTDNGNVPVEAVKETAEEKRKRIFAKRTNEDQAMSAKERYLARKRAKLSQPTLNNDDDD
jgi:coiled-coil domain-containing protein 55